MPREVPFHDIDLLIDDVSYALNVFKVTITNSVSCVFQPIFIRLRIDSQDVVLKEMYGNNNVKLIFRLMTDDIQEQDKTEIDLYILKILGGYSQKPNNQYTHPLSNYITLICIPQKPWKYMTSVVNYLSEDISPKSPFDVVNSIVDGYIPDVKKDIYSKNANNYKPEQIPVPPMNFAAAMDFLDERYSIYKGPLFYQCIFEENTFYMCDLSTRISDPEVYTIWNLAQGKKENEEIYKKSGADDITFYTYNNIHFHTRSGEIVGGDKYTNRFTVKPKNKFYEVVEMTADDAFLPKDGGELLVHDDMKIDNIRYYSRSFVGVDDDKSVMTSKLSKKYLFQSQATIKMNRTLRTKNLFRVGIPIMLKAEVENYTRVHGKYLVSASRVTFDREATAHFRANAEIRIFRSNILTD